LIKLEYENLYALRLFQEAAARRGGPSATGEDGIKSFSVGISALAATRSGAAAYVGLAV